ncbi:hypothetical protein PG994_007375 [Apiospora phragmitis]|uniref:Uncharacterized protein n=1 Tax=Apiospora phragmitis TaxID=2905665 RepID=A0ABR1V0P4_9PEZI
MPPPQVTLAELVTSRTVSISGTRATCLGNVIGGDSDVADTSDMSESDDNGSPTDDSLVANDSSYDGGAYEDPEDEDHNRERELVTDNVKAAYAKIKEIAISDLNISEDDTSEDSVSEDDSSDDDSAREQAPSTPRLAPFWRV